MEVLIFCIVLSIPFITYTMITGTSSQSSGLSSGQALRIRTHPSSKEILSHETKDLA